MTITLYDLLASRSGLKGYELNILAGLPGNDIPPWHRSGREAPAEVIERLAALVAATDDAAHEALDEIARLIEQREARPAVVELALAATHPDARALGWPGRWAQLQALSVVAAHLIAVGIEVALVERRTTPTTTAAAVVNDAAGRYTVAASPTIACMQEGARARPQT